MITPQKFLEFAPRAKQPAAFASALSIYLPPAEITPPLRLPYFMAQAAHECAGFTRFVENLNYSAEGLRKTWPSRFNRATAEAFARKPESIANYVYANRLGNGTELSGDGWRFRGRGIFQLTGRDNYRKYGQLIGIDLEGQPELAEDPTVAVRVAVMYWVQNRLNIFADHDDLFSITRAINGGLNGLEDRREWLTKTKRIFKEETSRGAPIIVRPPPPRPWWRKLIDFIHRVRGA